MPGSCGKPTPNVETQLGKLWRVAFVCLTNATMQVATRVKGGKTYKLASADHAELEIWSELINEYATYGKVTKRVAPFLKLGGRKLDKWQERIFSLDENGLTW